MTSPTLLAAEILEREAAALRECHTVAGDWRGDVEAQADHDEMLAVAKALRDSGMVLKLCESQRLVMRPGQLYRFEVDDSCAECRRIAALTTDPPGPLLIGGPITRSDMVNRLRAVAAEMHRIGSQMDYAGGFGEIGEHGREMIGAAAIAIGWAEGIESSAAYEESHD